MACAMTNTTAKDNHMTQEALSASDQRSCSLDFTNVTDVFDNLFAEAVEGVIHSIPSYVFRTSAELASAWHSQRNAKHSLLTDEAVLDKAVLDEAVRDKAVLDEALVAVFWNTDFPIAYVCFSMDNSMIFAAEVDDATSASNILEFCIEVHVRSGLPELGPQHLSEAEVADAMPNVHAFAAQFFSNHIFTTHCDQNWQTHYLQEKPQKEFKVWFDTAKMRLTVRFIQE